MFVRLRISDRLSSCGSGLLMVRQYLLKLIVENFRGELDVVSGRGCDG